MDGSTVNDVATTRLQVDADQLISALQTHEFGAVWFLDLKTGEIGLYWDGMLNGEQVEEEFDIDEFIDPERHELIEGIRSSESYQVMEAFIGTLAVGNERETLFRAISGRKPFRKFKDALFDLGDVREAWFKFEAQAYRRMAQEWLDERGIDAELK